MMRILLAFFCSTCSRCFPFFSCAKTRREGRTLAEVRRLSEICYQCYSTDASCPLKTVLLLFEESAL